MFLANFASLFGGGSIIKKSFGVANMADERQILVASLREHFEGIVEATDLFLQNLSADNASREELEAARGANSVLKSECADWRKRALETNGALKELKRQFTELEQRSDKMRLLCVATIGSLKEHAPELYAKYNAELVALLGTEPAAEPVAEAAAATAAEPASEAAAAEPTAEPATEAAAEPIAEPVAEAAAVEPTAEPAAEATVEPTAESVAEAAAVEPTAEPVVETAAPPKKSSKHADPKAALRELVKVSMSAGRGLKGLKGASGSRRLKKAANKEAAVETPASHESASKPEENSDKPDPAAAEQSVVSSTVEPAAGTVTEATAEPAAEAATETTAEPAAEAATEATAEPATEAATETTAEPAAEVATEATAESATEAVTEATVEPAAETSAEATVEPATEAVTEATAEPVDEAAATEPVTEPEEEPIVNNSKLKLPMFTDGRLKDRLEVALDAALADRLDKISDIVEQTEDTEKLSPLELLPQFSEDIHFVVSDDLRIIDEVKAGFELSENGEYDLALAKFARLLKQDSYILQPNLAILHNYINMARWEDAYKAGLPLLYDTFGTDYWESYVKDMAQAVINKMSVDKSEIDTKKLLFVLALLCAKYPVTARKFLCLADAIAEKCPDEAALHYYLLKVGVTSASINNTVEALQEITTCPELFDELFEQAKDPINKKYKPVLDMIEALYLSSKDEAKDVEDKIESLVPLGPVQISPADIERYHSKVTADKVVGFMLNELFPKAGFEPAAWPERFNSIVEEAKLIPFNFKPAELFQRFNSRIFRLSNVELRYYDGQEQFFIKAFNFEKGKIFILHAKMAELTPAEQQFIILRKCFQLYHKHTQLWYSRLSLDDTMMCKLLETVVKMCIESGIEAAEPWLKVVGNYDADTPNLYRKISETITRLYRMTDYKPFLILKEFLFARRPFTSVLDGDANRFAAKAVGITEASYGLARLFAGMRSDYDILAQDGFCALYADLQAKDEFLRKSLQLLWTSYLQNNDYI